MDIYTALKSLQDKRFCIPSVSEIEQDMVNIEGASSSSSTVVSVNSTPMKKKKVRRKVRDKSTPPDSDNLPSTSIEQENVGNLIVDTCDSGLDIYDVLNNMKITAVSSQATGSVLRIKRHFYQRINTKFFKYECDLTHAPASCCSCRCHFNKPIRNDAFFRDNKKFEDDSGSPKLALPHVNGLNLQFEDVSMQSQSNISTKLLPKKKIKKEKVFYEYRVLNEVLVGLESGEYMQGTIRINAKHFKEAYVTSTNDERDYLLPTVVDRNRALEGDVVAIKLKPQEEWTERLKTASVVSILERVHPRTAVGFLQPPVHNSKFVVLVPRDMRVPRIRIPLQSLPQSLNRHSNRYESILYKAKIDDWISVKFANGQLLESLGFQGDLESETAAILAEHDLDITPFQPDVLASLRITDAIPIGEFAYRDDLRRECVFTIDPMTARDLDDAVSCKELKNGNLEIGVHISDVSFYLPDGSSLDKIVRSKATTIYLVNNVYHMLPQELCLHCSLLPGKDKLAFSVFWEMTKSGEIISQRFARTIINSAAQLSYEDAQAMIENPYRIFDESELPQIYGGFTQRDLSRIVNYLQKIAINLRSKRFENGALRIDQTKLLFRIDEDTGEPFECFVYENKEAHRLIEEFMLLANISVATKIADDFPDKAFLRCHDPPKMHMLVEIQKTLKKFNVDFDISTSKSLQSSILAVGNTFGNAQMGVLNHLLAKPMVRARYFCSGDNSVKDFSHYALSVPMYTHFTSPIRRYADIMVHRLLSGCLNYTEEPNWNTRYITTIANNCNKQKYSAKCAGDASSDLYLAHYVSEHQPFVRDAVVIDIKLTSFEILVSSTGTVLKLFTNTLGKDIDCEVDSENKKLVVTFQQTPEFPQLKYEIQLFSVVTVALQRKPKTIKLDATLVRPFTSRVFTRQTTELLVI